MRPANALCLNVDVVTNWMVQNGMHVLRRTKTNAIIAHAWFVCTSTWLTDFKTTRAYGLLQNQEVFNIVARLSTHGFLEQTHTIIDSGLRPWLCWNVFLSWSNSTLDTHLGNKQNPADAIDANVNLTVVRYHSLPSNYYTNQAQNWNADSELDL